MEIFKVPTREVEVQITTDAGTVLDAAVYTTERGPDGCPGRVADRLNEPGDFIPVRADGESFLLNKLAVVTVRVPDGTGELTSLEGAEPHDVPVRLTLAGGHTLVGDLMVCMPEGKHRALDFLNEAPRFIPLRGRGVVHVIQRSCILFVRTLSEES